MKIGIFGGTFAPPHNTHIEMAKESLLQLELDKLFVLPCGFPPHKFSATYKFDRLEMTRLAFCGLNNTFVDTYEIDRGGKNYSYETLLHFKELYPLAQLYFIIGGDSLRDFPQWKNPQIIADNATLAVCRRKGLDFLPYAEKARQNYNAKIKEVRITQSDISSRAVRCDLEFFNALSFVPVAAGKNSLDLIPQSVMEYINQKGLYKEHFDDIKKLALTLEQERLSHTYHVIQTALALPSGIEEEKVFTAALLHDCAKQIKKERWGQYGFENNCCGKVAHAKLGALVAQKDFGVIDKEILDAIYYHTTARPAMTALDMTIYIADKLEPSREYPVSHLFKESLEETFLVTFKEALQKLKARGGEIDSLSLDAEAFYFK